VRVETPNVFDVMRGDLDLVRDKVAEAASLEYPIVSGMVSDIVAAGGKKLRPLVLLLSGKTFMYDQDRLVTAAAGVELLHIASLVHDDSIDRAAIRRGKPTLNSRINTGAVILIGDFLFAQSAMLAAATENTRVVSIFASVLGDICDGQLREMLDGHNVMQSRDEYLMRIFGKTASLFAGAAEMGAVIGGANDLEIHQMRAYGSDLGMAFQIIDDVLDLREQSDVIGKPSGNDLRQGVITLPTMCYMEGLPVHSEQFQLVERVVSGEEVDDTVVDQLVADIRRSGALETATTLAEEYIVSARDRLVMVGDYETRRHLEDILELAISRTT
jgi:geranylgeranyl pyrophosphate synthase